MTDGPSPREILQALAANPDFDALRSKFPRLTDKALRSIFEDAVQRFPEPVPQVQIKTGKSQWVAYIDGASRGNPGPAGAGVCIHTGGGVIELTRFIGRDTNNAAEYEALLLALSTAVENEVGNIEIRSDSQLLVRQMIGRYKVKNPGLAKRFIKAKNLEKKLKSFKITHIRRELNCDADRLANKAIDDAVVKGD